MNLSYFFFFIKITHPSYIQQVFASKNLTIPHSRKYLKRCTSEISLYFFCKFSLSKTETAILLSSLFRNRLLKKSFFLRPVHGLTRAKYYPQACLGQKGLFLKDIQ